jgi:retron-type reverse transcriptase
MSKTHNKLWEEITDWDNLYKAFLAARKGKRYKPGALRFCAHLEENITNIQNHLLWGSWQPSPWKEFMVYDPKQRLIQAPPFKDRVVHHALVDTIEPLFEKKFIFDSYACRRGKGFHQAVKRVQTFIRRATATGDKVYVLKADIAKYFPSINHDALVGILHRTIEDKQVLGLLEVIIRNTGFDVHGIPVGALTSQLYANIYLDRLDHYIKDDLGVKLYCRYMDDFIIVHNSKRVLWDLLEKVAEFLTDELKLTLNPKTSIFPAVRGVDFCGYRVWRDYILPRKRIIRHARRNFTRLARLCSQGKIPLETVRQSVMSFLGYMKHCNGYKTTEHILAETIIRRNQ